MRRPPVVCYIVSGRWGGAGFLTQNYNLIDDQPGYRRAVKAMSGARRIGLDLESNGFFRYPERVCLVQVSTPSGAFVIDPLAVEDLSDLGEALANPKTEIILHSGSYDIVSLDRDWGFRVGSLFDTQIAAAFVGIRRLGLAPVLESVLGVSIPKEKNIQRSDWSIRPLSQKALAYAAGDVLHLFNLRDELADKLRSLGRAEWAAEECRRLAALRYEKPDPEMAVFQVKGWRDLDSRGLAILKSLVEFREDQAAIAGRPRFRVIPDMALTALARKPDSDLRGVRGLGRFGRGRAAAGLRKAIADGKAAPAVRPPPRPRPPRLSRAENAAAGSRLATLKLWRSDLGKSLGLDPPLLWPMTSLQRLSRDPDSLEAELRSEDVRNWQRAEFADNLDQILRRLG